jgi:uncharacterized protein (TIGR02246 family)
MVGVQGTRQEIEQRVREFEAALNRRDAAALAAMYTDDARLMPPGSGLVSGRQAIQQFWQGAFDMGLSGGELRPQQIEARDDLAYEMSTATLRMGDAGTQAVKYVVVWKRQSGGGWQMAVDIWNANTSG